ncbi:MAG TPA: CCA tRNA nucleotidyltransferase [Bryobacteraceae bacterium]|nr:CCA tRNA nucleotidyltransferase [Bryobacteraceae bacterium]
MVLPPEVLDTLARLHENGHQAYLVGGCVRDTLLQLPAKDWDIATDAPPARILSLFPSAEPIGAHFGVVLYRGVEIAAFRSDGPYHDARRPSSVQFETDPAADAARRDFTINGLFYDTQTNQVLDFVNGRADLANKQIRAIGDPAARFAEDNLRLLRAVRFAARFGFEIEPATLAAIRAHSANIANVAAERTQHELSRILTGPSPRRGIELLDETGLLAHILPEVKALQGVPQPPDHHPEGDVWTHTLLLLDGLRQPTLTLAWAALLHDIAKPATFTNTDRIRFLGHDALGAKMAVAILGRLKYSAAVIEQVRDHVAGHMKFFAVRTMKESTRKRFLRQSHFAELLELHHLDIQASNGNTATYDFCRDQLANTPPEVLAPPKLLTGSDLIALGVPEGPAVGRVLRELEDAQLEGRIASPAEASALVRQRLPAL